MTEPAHSEAGRVLVEQPKPGQVATGGEAGVTVGGARARPEHAIEQSGPSGHGQAETRNPGQLDLGHVGPNLRPGGSGQVTSVGCRVKGRLQMKEGQHQPPGCVNTRAQGQ